MIRVLQAQTGSCTFLCLFHNNLKLKLLWKKQGKMQMRRVPVLACNTVVVI